MTKEYSVRRYVDTYINDQREYAFKLSKTFSFPIEFTKNIPVSKIGIFFATYKKSCNGRMRVSIIFDKKTGLECDVDIANILDNAPLVLNLGDKVQVASSVHIKIDIHYEDDNPLAIWVNARGPCVKIQSFQDVSISLKGSPLISIVTPIYKTGIKDLKETIKSVKRQAYKNWELCLIDDGSKDKALSKYLYGLKDKRIKVKINKTNKGISLVSNQGIGMCTGEYIGFLDHDDILDESALLEVAKSIEENPKVDIIYSDEDKLSDTGKSYGAFYKPDWDYTMFLSYNYTCHFSVYRSSLIKKIGGFRPGFEGSQDYDLMLRAVEKTDQIIHIPMVLYHWKASEGSTSLGIGNKNNARINAVRALNSHIKRTGQNATVEGGKFQGMYDVRFGINESPRVLIIVPFRDNIIYVKNLLYSLECTGYSNYKVLLIDNGSKRADSLKFIRHIILNKNTEKGYKIYYTNFGGKFNFSKINNYGAKRPVSKTSKYLLFLNNDTEVLNSSWLYEMVSQAEREDVSAVGAKLLYSDHSIQHAGLFIGVNGVAGHGHKGMMDWHPGYFARPHIPQEISAVTGACMLVNRKDFLSVGGFDENLPTAFNDVDLCLKIISMGKKVVYTPHARLIHYESASRDLDSMGEKGFDKAIKYMDNKWGCLKYEDPHYNPNLTKSREDFSAGM